MALSPIAFIAPNYRDFKTYWLKAYEPGTTTPKSMALDSAGVVTVAKLQLNADGFLESAGGALVIPYLNGAYDLWLFPTEPEADANDTSSAEQLADDITGVLPDDAIEDLLINDPSQTINFDTVAEYKAFTKLLPVKKRVYLADRDSYFSTVAGTGSGNDIDVMDSDEVSQNISIIDEDVLIPEKYGCNGLGNNAVNDSAVFEILFAKDKPMLCKNSYLLSQRFTAVKWIVSGGGTFKMTGTNFGFLECTGSDSNIDNVNFLGDGAVNEVSLSTDLCIEFSSYSARNNTVRGCSFKDFTFVAVQVKSKNSYVDDNTFENIGSWAVTSFNRFVYITNNTLISCGNSLTPYSGGGITIGYSAVDGFTMATTMGERNYILNNTISTSTQVGIDTHSGFDLQVQGNIIKDTDLDAIFLHRTRPTAEGLGDADGRVTNCVVSENIIEGCGFGITLSTFETSDATDRLGCLNNTIRDNIVRNCTNYGINLARGSSKNTVKNNDIDGGVRPIYIFFWCDSNLITDNRITADGTTAFLMDINANNTSYKCNDNVIENNVFDMDGFDCTAIRNQLGCELTIIKNNELLNRGLLHPITDAESGTERQAQIVHLPRAWSTTNPSISDMVGEKLDFLFPSAGGFVGEVCVTAGDEASINGVWKTYGAISV